MTQQNNNERQLIAFLRAPLMVTWAPSSRLACGFAASTLKPERTMIMMEPRRRPTSGANWAQAPSFCPAAGEREESIDGQAGRSSWRLSRLQKCYRRANQRQHNRRASNRQPVAIVTQYRGALATLNLVNLPGAGGCCCCCWWWLAEQRLARWHRLIMSRLVA